MAAFSQSIPNDIESVSVLKRCCGFYLRTRAGRWWYSGLAPKRGDEDGAQSKGQLFRSSHLNYIGKRFPVRFRTGLGKNGIVEANTNDARCASGTTNNWCVLPEMTYTKLANGEAFWRAGRKTLRLASFGKPV